MSNTETKADGEQEVLHMLAGGELAPEQEIAAVEAYGRRSPAALLPLTVFCLGQKAKLKAELDQAVRERDELQDKLSEAPWHPARFCGVVAGADPRAVVSVGGRRCVVVPAPGLDLAALTRGSSVYLNSAMNVLLAPGPDLSSPGNVGIFTRRHNGRAVVRVPAGEEVVLDLADGLKEGLEAGSLVLYDPDSRFAFERVDPPPQDDGLLVELPADVNIDHLGGLGEQFREIVEEIALHLSRPDLVKQSALDSVKGVLFAGPPGCGKTSIVRALGAHLRDAFHLDVRILLMRPGVHRGSYFGESEERIRRISAHACSLAREGRFVLLFIDDIDQLGSREDSVASAIDTRLIPAFLQEIESMRSVERLMLVAATNRPDLLDQALVRPGRIDKVYNVPRPNRAAAAEIFRKYLALGANRDRGEADEILAERAVTALYAANGSLHLLGQLVLRDASRRPVTAPELLSGALIRGSVAAAKRAACFRGLRGGPSALCAADLLDAVAAELKSIARQMRPGPALRQMLDLPTDLDVIKVELPPEQENQLRYRYVRLG